MSTQELLGTYKLWLGGQSQPRKLVGLYYNRGWMRKNGAEVLKDHVGVTRAYRHKRREWLREANLDPTKRERLRESQRRWRERNPGWFKARQAKQRELHERVLAENKRLKSLIAQLGSSQSRSSIPAASNPGSQQDA